LPTVHHFVDLPNDLVEIVRRDHPLNVNMHRGSTTLLTNGLANRSHRLRIIQWENSLALSRFLANQRKRWSGD